MNNFLMILDLVLAWLHSLAVRVPYSPPIKMPLNSQQKISKNLLLKNSVIQLYSQIYNFDLIHYFYKFNHLYCVVLRYK